MLSWSVLKNCPMITSLSAYWSLKVICVKLVLELYDTLIEQRRQNAPLFLTEKCPGSQNMQEGLIPQEYNENRLVWEEQIKLYSARPLLIWGTILQAETGLTLAM